MVTQAIDRYKILRKIGSGGMGEVYLAEDPVLDRMVALKVLRSEFETDPAGLARFVKEAKAASALDHPGVAHIYEIGQYQGQHFIAMQYCEGKTLAEKIQNVALNESEVADIAIQIADALEEAHSKGIIHRDIKPQNIMCTTRGQIKILDFGLAKRTGSKTDKLSSASGTEVGVILGTIYYMSPEQALAKPIDHRTDIYSLGVVLYQMVAGILPYKAATPVETLQKILKDPPEPIRAYNPNVSPELQRIIEKCLEKEPTKRYQSAAELLHDLRTFKRVDSGQITTPLQIRPNQPKLFRFSTIALIIVTLLAVGIALFSTTREKPIRSLAVLPFVNQSPEGESDYLSDGITDNIINKLSQVPDLKVLSRGTVFTYKGKEVDPRKVGRELNVDAVVTGRLLQSGDNISLQISLVRTSDGVQLWGERYNRTLLDILNMQTEISNDISSKLPQKVSGEVRQQMSKAETKNLEAYQLYSKGRYFLNKRTREDSQRAIQSFLEAIALDKDYALAHSGLADAFLLMSNWGYLPASDGFVKAKDFAEKAVALDHTLAEAYTSLATIKSNFEWNWKEAEKDFQKAIELNPNYSAAHHWYSFYLSMIGRHEQALEEIRYAQRLDPLSLIINANVGFTLYLAREYDESLVELQQTIDLDPKFPLAYQYLGYVYEQKKDYPRSIAAFEKAIDLDPDNLTLDAALARVLAISGKRQQAQQMLDRLFTISTQTHVSPYHIACALAGMNRKQEALDWLEKAYAQRSDQVTLLRIDPRMDSLRNEPRFKDLLKQIGLN